MLRHLRIADFAIIAESELSFKEGMTALTGETGAGKSILLDALNLVLGDRADLQSIREGAERADITASFDITDVPAARQWLQEREMDTGTECILRRTISAQTGSKGFINGTPVTLHSLRELGEMLVNLHGQHEHQTLTRREIQRQRLDDYANHPALLERIAQLHHTWRGQFDRWQQLQAAANERTERLAILRFQVNELSALDLQENEWLSLNQEHQRLANASRLMSSVQLCLQVLDEHEETHVYNLLIQATRALTDVAALDPQLQTSLNALETAQISIEETASDLRRYLSSAELDPKRLEFVEQRMRIMHDLSRKHRIDANDLLSRYAELQNELDTLEHADENLQSLETELQQLAQQYREAAEALHKSRVKVAAQLSKQVTQGMQILGMAGGVFEIAVDAKTINVVNGEGFSAHGADSVEFRVAANPGQTPRALGKVASGGELSRISLAVQMITAGSEPIPTLIFDEVDAGIGGAIAEVVGMHLRLLGEHRQVMCVTHLAQVAAQAHQHLQVSKQTEKAQGVAHTRVHELSEADRVKEIARMLGGMEMTEQTLLHAEEMIVRAQKRRA
ncbi:MAG: DNA repair protein RecN [Gammaproteobacteria bacterium]|nr:DNA repair protein RecN [Gammaproteobacteria bacterium]